MRRTGRSARPRCCGRRHSSRCQRGTGVSDMVTSPAWEERAPAFSSAWLNEPTERFPRFAGENLTACTRGSPFGNGCCETHIKTDARREKTAPVLRYGRGLDVTYPVRAAGHSPTQDWVSAGEPSPRRRERPCPAGALAMGVPSSPLSLDRTVRWGCGVGDRPARYDSSRTRRRCRCGIKP